LRLVVLFSGGKDSTYALWYALHQGWTIACLLTFIPRSPGSWMFHYPLARWTRLQAQTLGLTQVTVETRGLGEEEELRDLSFSLEKLRETCLVDGVVSGVVESAYQKRKVDRVCQELGLKSLTPLWYKDPWKLLETILEAGFHMVFAGVAAQGFDAGWLGRSFDFNCFKDLKNLNKRYGVHPSGEGGEFETFVTDAPIFRERVEFTDVEKIWLRDGGYIDVRDARLKPKAGDLR